MKRYFCDKCGDEVDIESDGYVQMRVTCWSHGGRKPMEYVPDPLHNDGYEEYMMCASCANDVFGTLEGMERA